MINNLLKFVDADMQKVMTSYNLELGKVRTGIANVGLVDSVKVDYYGNETSIKNIANITVSDARTVVITPWEKQFVKVIEKAIQNADLGLNPIGEASLVRVPVPVLTEERRREMVKIVKNIAENSRVAIRNVRRGAMDKLKESLKKKDIDEDMERHSQNEIQKITDRFIEEIDKIARIKEEELLKV